jgi:hypothetical protein
MSQVRRVKNFNNLQQLDLIQKNILKKFIIAFLPQRGNRRKGLRNEIEYTRDALGRIFNQYFNFSITREHILEVFEELEYPIYLKKGEWNSDKKDFLPSNKGTTTRKDEGYTSYDAAFIYIDIEPTTVGQLRLVTAGLPSNTNQERVKEKEEMVKRICSFKKTVRA